MLSLSYFSTRAICWLSFECSDLPDHLMFRTFNSLLSVPHDCIEFVAFISFFALLSYSAVPQLVAASAESIVFPCVAIPLKVQSL